MINWLKKICEQVKNKKWEKAWNAFWESPYIAWPVLVIVSLCAVYLCFKFGDGARNLILLLAGLIGWYFLSRRTQAAEDNVRVAEQDLFVEQLTRAMEQLANDKVHVRMGGVLGLEQIALSKNTEVNDRKKIARILVSFIRTRATIGSEECTKDLKTSGVADLGTAKNANAYRIPRLDVEAAVNALAQIAYHLEKQEQFREQFNERKCHLCDLQRTDLRGLRFVEANLSNFTLMNADVSDAWMRQADLSGAKLKGATFDRVWLVRTDLIGADFTEGDSSESKASFVGTNLSAADFEGAEGLTQEQIDKAYYWVDSRNNKKYPPCNLPDGLKPPPNTKELPEDEDM